MRTITTITLWILGIYGLMLAAAYEPIIPCTTDSDCMAKNPHIEFSLESK